MKVLYVCPGLNIQRGGAITAVVNLARTLSAKGVSISIFAPRSDCEEYGYTDELKNVNVEFFKKGLLSKIWTGYSPRLARNLKKRVREFDLIHIHELWHYPAFSAYRAAKRAGIPFVITAHGELTSRMRGYKSFRKKIYMRFVQKDILKNARALHAITREEVKDFYNLTKHGNVVHIPNGLDVEEFKNLPNADIFKNVFPETKNKKIILFLGRMHPVKGIDILAQAFGALAKNRNDVRLIIAGPDNEGYLRNIVKILKKEKALEKTVFTDMVSGELKKSLLRAADIFVLPSHSEVLGLSTLEAMVCGVPVIISKNCNFPEVEERFAGKVINMTRGELCKTLDFLLDNTEIRAEMGENGKRLIEDQYTLDVVGEKIKTFYEDIVLN
ncbi:MAG: glycosyltransferase [Candidatus Omnitrophota bacterium]